MTARVLMFQGTGSDVGKSLIVAGLCRLLANRGLSVRPFKPQNMSNNAAVTEDGGEIGRAQALQARAARVAPSVDMNPVLLKPQSEVGAQIVVQGRVFGNARAREYQSRKAELMPYVLDSFAKIRAQCDVVLVEGAGSASEVNLRANDIANMGVARTADVPVVLIGDIDRGGVIASLCGTAAVVDPDDGKLIAGFIVNKMRGDPSLFATGMTFVAARTGWAPLGLVPHFPDAHRLPAEDVFGLTPPGAACASSCRCCRTSPISTISIRCGSSPVSRWCCCATGRRFRSMLIWSSCLARRRRLQIWRRCAPAAGMPTSSRMPVAAGACSACAAAIRCWVLASPTPMALKDRRDRLMALACSTSRRN
jgi:dethiobiotin synthetase